MCTVAPSKGKVKNRVALKSSILFIRQRVVGRDGVQTPDEAETELCTGSTIRLGCTGWGAESMHTEPVASNGEASYMHHPRRDSDSCMACVVL